MNDPTRPDPADALDRLMGLALQMADRMDAGMVRGGLTRARSGVIWHLHRHGPVVQRDLAAALRMTPRNVTGLVDALEATGFVVRQPHPADRRATLVRLTSQGESAVAAMETDRERFANQLFGSIGPRAMTQFSRVLDRLLDVMAQGDASTRAGQVKHARRQ